MTGHTTIDSMWKNRARQIVNADGANWKPCICIQGGGAKGAWEAGVLSSLLDNTPTQNPVAVFGTSAGALNAMWASTLRPETSTGRLLDNWRYLATLVFSIAVVIPSGVLSLIIGLIISYQLPLFIAFALATCVVFPMSLLIHSLVIDELFIRGFLVICSISLSLSICALIACMSHILGIALLALLITLILLAQCLKNLAVVGRWRLALFERMWRRRWPGLFSVSWLGHRLPKPEQHARFDVYMCAADVTIDDPPVDWDWNSLGVFHLKQNETEAYLIQSNGKVRYDLRTAAMCSAALPIMCRPYQVDRKQFLDGGLEANLPVGFIRQSGLLGGRCAICIVPHPIKSLNSDSHVDYRTIRFLWTMKSQQAYYRATAANASAVGHSSCGPAYTHYPILIVAPEQRLEAALLDGFLRPHTLPQDFQAGRKAGSALANAMNNFLAGDDEALNSFLLDHTQLPNPHGPIPLPGCWALWANPKWLKRPCRY